MNDAQPFDFAAWLEAMKLTHGEAARRLGVSESYVSMLVCDPGSSRYRKPSKRIVERCSEIACQRLDEIKPFAR